MTAQDAVDASYLAGLRDGRKHAEELFAAKYADLVAAVKAFDPSNTDLWERDLHAALEALEEP